MQVAQPSASRSLSVSTKTFLIAGTLLGGLVFLLIVEFGVNAGRVHYGVTVAGHDVGGLTITELQDELTERGDMLRSIPVCFERDLIELCLNPEEVGWRPEPRATADVAYDVGRVGSLWDALSERATAWVDGVNVQWEGGPNAGRVSNVLNRWERIFAVRGKELRRGLMRYRIRRAIVTHPRETFRIPLR